MAENIFQEERVSYFCGKKQSIIFVLTFVSFFVCKNSSEISLFFSREKVLDLCHVAAPGGSAPTGHVAVPTNVGALKGLLVVFFVFYAFFLSKAFWSHQGRIAARKAAAGGLAGCLRKITRLLEGGLGGFSKW